MKRIGKNLGAPFKVVRCFWYILLWWILIFFTLLGPMADAFGLQREENGLEYFIHSGTLYYSVITLLLTYFITILLDLLFEQTHQQEKSLFLHYQIVAAIFAVMVAVFYMVLYMVARDTMWLQIGGAIIGYAFAFYLYCVSFMPRLANEIPELAYPYDKQRKDNSETLQKSTQDASDGVCLAKRDEEDI